MKYQRLVSNTTPFSLLQYLEDQLEERGIDSVFARYILSILDQDCVDIEPYEHLHAQKHHVKEFQKCNGRRILYSLPKFKNKKWETWEKQILSSPPCCNETCLDVEKVKRNAAVECLRSICDVNDAENLINEVCIKLKNFKNQNGDKEDKSCGKVNTVEDENFFYIAPSSPTNDVEKYFAAFPPLNSKVEENSEFNTINISPWYRSCTQEMKYEPKNKSENNLDKHITRKSNQPIIPYGSLKSIKNVYKCNITQLLANEINIGCFEKENCSFLKYDFEVLDISSFQNTKSLKYLTEQFVLLKANCADIKPSLKISPWIFLVMFNKLNVDRLIENILNNVETGNSENLNNAGIVCLNKLPFIRDFMVIFAQSYCGDLKYTSSSNCMITDAFITKKLKDVKNTFFTVHNFEVNGEFYSSNLSEKKKKASHKNLLDLQDFQKNIPIFNQLSMFPLLKSDVLCVEYKFFPIYLLNPLIYTHIFNAFHNMENFDVGECVFLKINENCNMLKYDNCEEDTKKDSSVSAVISSIANQVDTSVGQKSNSGIMSINQDIMDICLRGKTYESVEINPDVQIPSEEECQFSLYSNDNFSSCDDLFNLKCDYQENILSYDRHTRFSVSENIIEMYSKNILKDLKFGENLSSCACVNCDLFLAEDFYTRPNVLTEHKNSAELKEDIQKEDQILKYTPITQDVLLLPKSEENQNEFFLMPANLSRPSNDKLNFNSGGILNDKFSLCKPPLLANNSLVEYEASSKFHFHSEQYFSKPCQGSKYLSDMKQSTQNYVLESSSTAAPDLFLSAPESSKDSLEESLKFCENKWFLYLGENQIDVERTWQKDFVSPVKVDKKFNHYSQSLCDDNFEACLAKDASKNFNIMFNSNEDQIRFPQNEDYQEQLPLNFNKEINLKNCGTDMLIEHKNLVESKSINECFDIYCRNECPDFIPDDSDQSKTNACFNLSAFYPSNNYEEWQTDCTITTEWSNGSSDCISSPLKENAAFNETVPLLHDDSLNFNCDYTFDSSYNFQMEQFEPQFNEEFDAMQMSVIMDSNENITDNSIELADCYVERQSRKKSSHSKRPCSYYLQGSCSRPDCKYSHDVSYITCRFWKKGSCFKGELCPFLHGYIRYIEESSLDDDNSIQDTYSLESETDFPSLDRAVTEPPEIYKESNPVNIVQDKSRKKRKKKFHMEQSSA